jgi:4-amino-4-deoxy-L-arabinose transferase-like glycosyltransferase
MIPLMLVQLVSGVIAGCALEYLLRTKPSEDALRVRWLALALSSAGLLAYAYILGSVIKAFAPSDFVMLASAVVLLAATAAAFAISRRRSA